MTEHSQTKNNNDPPAQALMKRLEERKEEKKSLAEKAHRTGTLIHAIMQGINNIFSLMSSALTAYKEVPVIGFALQMVALVPQAVSTLTNPDASIPAKIFAGSLLAAITSLSITAFVLGAAPAAIIGLVVASLAGVMQGLELIGKVFEKLNATKTHEHVKAFNNLIKSGCENPNTIPDSNDFNEDFAIRSVELSFFSNKRLAEIEQEQAIKKEQVNAFVDSNIKDMGSLEGLKKLRDQYKEQPAPPLFNELIDLETEKLQIISERAFVEQVVDKKNIIIEPDSAADKLKNLYLLREERLTDLTAKIAVLNQSPPEKEASTELLDDILKLQKKIIKIDSKIEEITKPAEKIKLAHLLGNEKLARTFTNFALSGAGILFSVMAVLLVVGSVAAPPFVLPIMAGFGIGLAAFGVIKWAMEKSADMADEENKIKQDQKQGESILNEAIDGYQHQQSKEHSHTGSCSYSKHMKDLLQTIAEPQPQSHKASQVATHSSEVKPEPHAPVLVEDNPIESDVAESQTLKF
jgi:hypothetical protein